MATEPSGGVPVVPAKAPKVKGPTMAEQLAKIVDINLDEAKKRADDRKVQIEHGNEIRNGFKTIKEAIEKLAGNSVCKANCSAPTPVPVAPNVPPAPPVKTAEEKATADKRDQEQLAKALRMKEAQVVADKKGKWKGSNLWILMFFVFLAIIAIAITWWVKSNSNKQDAKALTISALKTEVEEKDRVLGEYKNKLATATEVAKTVPIPVPVPTPEPITMKEKVESQVMYRELPTSGHVFSNEDGCPDGGCEEDDAKAFEYRLTPGVQIRKGVPREYAFAKVVKVSGSLPLVTDCVKNDGCYNILVSGGPRGVDGDIVVKIIVSKKQLGNDENDQVHSFGPLR